MREAAGTIEHVVAVQEDVTARVEAEEAGEAGEAERYANERFRVIIDASPDVLALFRPIRTNREIVDFEWLYANPAGQKGMDSGSVAGKSLLGTYPVLVGSELLREYVRVLLSGEPFRQEYQHGSKDAPEWSAITALRAGNEIAVTYTDITPRKLAERYLATATRSWSDV